MLKEFLDAKPLYYDEIDYTRMPRVYEKIKKFLKISKIIHIVGTNGKGTTGRFLSSALHSIGFSVGHYTSPHILEFNERIWIDSNNIDDELLELLHVELQKLLHVDDSNALSYFEYTTFLAIIAFKDCDYVIMEAGLGGEHDATAVFEKILTLVTPISFDHEAFLGDNIQKIAKTKLNAMQNYAILAKQENDEVYTLASEVSNENGVDIRGFNELLDSSDLQNINTISKELSLAQYLQENLSLSISALKFLKINYKTADFKEAKLFGRLTKIAQNIIVDVGHNTLAATRIAQALSGNKYIIIYNSYKDKNYKEILEILKPITLHVEIIELQDKRVELGEQLQSTLNNLKIKWKMYKGVKKDSNYLVFGSFSVVEAFLKGNNG